MMKTCAWTLLAACMLIPIDAVAQPPAIEQATKPAAMPPTPPTKPTLTIAQSTHGRISKDKLTNAAAYLTARIALMERIEKEFPKFAEQARAAAVAYGKALGPGQAGIITELKARDPAAAKSLEKSLADEIPKMATDAKLSEDILAQGAEAGFFDPKRQRIMHIPWLLTFTPAYVEHPEKEITDGWTRTQKIGIPMLTDKVLVATVPLSWATLNTKNSETPDQPSFAASAGVGPAMLLVQTQVQPDLKAGDKEWLANFMEGAVASQKAERVIGSKIETAATGEPAGTITLFINEKIKDRDTVMLSKMVMIPRDGFLLLISEQTYDPNPATTAARTREELQVVKDRYQPTFDSIVKSLTVKPREPDAK